MAARSIRARARPPCRAAIPVEQSLAGGPAKPDGDREGCCHVRHNERPNAEEGQAGLIGCGGRASIKTQAPCCPARHEGDTCCGEQPEVKFEPGIECAFERYQRLQKFARSGAPANVDHPKATRKLHRERGYGRAVTDARTSTPSSSTVIATLRAFAFVGGTSSETTAFDETIPCCPGSDWRFRRRWRL